MILEVAVSTLGIGGFIGTGLTGIVVISLSVYVPEVRIHGSQSALNTLFGFEKPWLIDTAGLLFQNIRACSQE